MNNVIIDKLKNKLKSATISRSPDIKISLEDCNILISEILDLYKSIITLQQEIINLQKDKEDTDTIIVSTSLNG